eukprot:COSAG02_NODE_441_length_22281_cov_6.119556_12_plen_63_part_00
MSVQLQAIVDHQFCSCCFTDADVRVRVVFLMVDLARRCFGTARDLSPHPVAGRPASTVDSMR